MRSSHYPLFAVAATVLLATSTPAPAQFSLAEVKRAAHLIRIHDSATAAEKRGDLPDAILKATDLIAAEESWVRGEKDRALASLFKVIGYAIRAKCLQKQMKRDQAIADFNKVDDICRDRLEKLPSFRGALKGEGPYASLIAAAMFSRGECYFEKWNEGRIFGDKMVAEKNDQEARASFDFIVREIASSGEKIRAYEYLARIYGLKGDKALEQENRRLALQLKGFFGVVSICHGNPSPVADITYQLRWQRSDGSFTEWENRAVTKNQTVPHWFERAAGCQIRFNGVLGDRALTLKVYFLELKNVPTDRKPTARDGQVYTFRFSDETNLDLYRKK